MALRFSEGLLSGLRNFGQQPMAQLNASLAQPVNTSQALAASLGGMFGVDMRSPAAIQQAEQKTQQEQAREVYSQALSASPEKQLELAKQLVNIPGYEAAAMQLAQQAQAKLQQGQETLARGQEEITSSINQTRRQTTLASRLSDEGYTTLASLVRQGDQEAYNEGLEILTKGAKEKEVKGSPQRLTTGYRDPAGNGTWEGVRINYSDGSSEIRYSNSVTGETSSTVPEGSVPVDLKTGETVTEERGRQSAADIATSRGKDWAKVVDEATVNLPDLQYSVNTLKRATNILSELPEGPLAASFRQTMFNIFGKRPQSDAEAGRIIADQVMETLQNFSGAISEGERAWAMEQGPQLSNDRAKNLGILTEMQRRAELLLKKAQLMSESETSAEYRQKIREAGLLEDYATQLTKSGEAFTVGNYQVKVK
jgi:hypothetical protein